MVPIGKDLRKGMRGALSAREQGLRYAQLFGELCDELTEALRSRQWRDDLPADIATFKRILVTYLEESGEARYQVLVRGTALALLELNPGDTAEEARAVAEAAVLEDALGCDL